MQKRNKNLLIISGGLGLSSLLILYMFSNMPDSSSDQQAHDISLRSDVTDVSLSDMMNHVENRKEPLNNSSTQGLIYNNGPADASVTPSDNPEAVARVQELLRANEENLSSGLQEIENERMGISAPSTEEQRRVPRQQVKREKERVEQETDREIEEPDTVAVVKSVKPSPFHTIALNNTINTNAIKAYVHSEQVVMAGSTLKMRLGEPAYTDNGTAIPKNSPVFGIVTSIDGERVNVEVTSVIVNGNILPFKKNVYSKDALLGIYVPGNEKSEATKEVTGGTIEAIPTSGIAQVDAAAQIATSIASSAVSAGKQALSKNVRKIKVTIKTNYEIYLRPDEK